MASLNARTSILASANPKESRYNPRLSVVESIFTMPTSPNINDETRYSTTAYSAIAIRFDLLGPGQSIRGNRQKISEAFGVSILGNTRRTTIRYGYTNINKLYIFMVNLFADHL